MPHKYEKKVPGEDPREFDNTSCTQSSHGRRVHRDYAAHFFRWGFVHRFVKAGHRVLDVGCGVDQPIPRILTDKLNHVPKLYLGVDHDPRVKPRYGFRWLEVQGGFDFTRRWRTLEKRGPFDVVVSFEVIEHMHKDAGLRMLKGVRGLMAKDGTFLMSTPVYDGRRMAQNHIHEYRIDELQRHVERAGLAVERRFGTFMDVKEIRKTSREHQAVAKELGCYYGHEVVSCFLAPLYPDLCRNNLWVVRR